MEATHKRQAVVGLITGPFGSANCKIIRHRSSEASRVSHPYIQCQGKLKFETIFWGLEKRYKKSQALITFHQHQEPSSTKYLQ